MARVLLITTAEPRDICHCMGCGRAIVNRLPHVVFVRSASQTYAYCIDCLRVA